jgi:hypothetical protein
VHGILLGDELLRPVVQHLSGRNVIGDAERQIQIGEPVARSSRERSHRGPGDDALVLLRELQHMCPEFVTLLDGEHAGRCISPKSWLPGRRPSIRSAV